ncbi:MAG TPA: hypothetical protein VG502_02810 [Flexivirga sp.]|uniref:hypothetical protein n=1 Tax=Flexivirga sp. TaxID=1962927 RepID=UPI002CB59210|nr:hypothetical protein [Flexivirga sp.]HWC21210.1 hypothetical protein [Flexivirga sp.]
MTPGRDVTYAVIARRRQLRWHVSVPGFGRATTFRRGRVEVVARQLIEQHTGQTAVRLVVLSRPRP